MVDGGVERTFNVVVEFCVEIVIEIKPGASSSSTAEDRSVNALGYGPSKYDCGTSTHQTRQQWTANRLQELLYHM